MSDDVTQRIVVALAVLVAISLLLPLLPTQDPLAIAIDQRLSAPNAIHWFGTDDLGRDMLSRVLNGAALTVGVSVLALLTSLAVGALLGSGAGYYYGQWPDRIFCWVADFVSAVPFIVLIASVLSLTGAGLYKAYFVLTAIIWVSPARIVRSEVIKTLPLDYVLAERSLGTPEWRILSVTVMPACIRSATTFSAAYLPEIIALEAGLSFLGLGVQPPNPGLGKMIFDGIAFISSAWWVAIFPAAMLFIVVLGVQLVAWTTRSGPRNGER